MCLEKIRVKSDPEQPQWIKTYILIFVHFGALQENSSNVRVRDIWGQGGREGGRKGWREERREEETFGVILQAVKC